VEYGFIGTAPYAVNESTYFYILKHVLIFLETLDTGHRYGVLNPAPDISAVEAVEVLSKFKVPHLDWVEASIQKTEAIEDKERRKGGVMKGSGSGSGHDLPRESQQKEATM
jgi:hypothetical protein